MGVNEILAWGLGIFGAIIVVLSFTLEAWDRLKRVIMPWVERWEAAQKRAREQAVKRDLWEIESEFQYWRRRFAERAAKLVGEEVRTLAPVRKSISQLSITSFEDAARELKVCEIEDLFAVMSQCYHKIHSPDSWWKINNNFGNFMSRSSRRIDLMVGVVRYRCRNYEEFGERGLWSARRIYGVLGRYPNAPEEDYRELVD